MKKTNTNWSILRKCRSNLTRAVIYLLTTGFTTVITLFFDNEVAQFLSSASFVGFITISALMIMQHFEALIRLGNISSITVNDIHGLTDDEWRTILKQTNGWPSYKYLQTKSYKELKRESPYQIE